jgi:hypothetical protein
VSFTKTVRKYHDSQSPHNLFGFETVIVSAEIRLPHFPGVVLCSTTVANRLATPELLKDTRPACSGLAAVFT